MGEACSRGAGKVKIQIIWRTGMLEATMYVYKICMRDQYTDTRRNGLKKRYIG